MARRPDVYLIHFNRPLKHARHYLGKTSNLEKRLADHRAGRGSRLLAVLRDKGIGWRLARVWRRPDRETERVLKQRHRAELCPLCSGPRAHRRGR